jgi:hypothetical protein
MTFRIIVLPDKASHSSNLRAMPQYSDGPNTIRQYGTTRDGALTERSKLLIGILCLDTD